MDIIQALLVTVIMMLLWVRHEAHKRAAIASLDDKPVILPPGFTFTPMVPEDIAKDAERYRIIRLGRYWSVIDGMGDTLRADELDAAVDASIARATGSAA